MLKNKGVRRLYIVGSGLLFLMKWTFYVGEVNLCILYEMLHIHLISKESPA